MSALNVHCMVCDDYFVGIPTKHRTVMHFDILSMVSVSLTQTTRLGLGSTLQMAWLLLVDLYWSVSYYGYRCLISLAPYKNHTYRKTCIEYHFSDANKADNAKDIISSVVSWKFATCRFSLSIFLAVQMPYWLHNYMEKCGCVWGGDGVH